MGLFMMSLFYFYFSFTTEMLGSSLKTKQETSVTHSMMRTDSKDCLQICREYIMHISLYLPFRNDPFYHQNICFPSCRIGPCFFQYRTKTHSPCHVTLKKVVFRQMKQLRKPQPSDPELLLNTAAEVHPGRQPRQRTCWWKTLLWSIL